MEKTFPISPSKTLVLNPIFSFHPARLSCSESIFDMNALKKQQIGLEKYEELRNGTFHSGSE